MNHSILLHPVLGVLFVALATTAFLPATGPKKIAHYAIEGAFCGGCVGALKATAEKIDGVEEVKVHVEERSVVVTFDTEKTTAEAIQKSINDETTFNLALNAVKDPPKPGRPR